MESTTADISTASVSSVSSVTSSTSFTTEPTFNGTTGICDTTTHIFDTYDVFIHPHWYQFPAVSDAWHYVIGVYITIVGITGIIGNSIVIWIFSTTRHLKTPSNMFVVNLALSDLIFSAVNGFPLLTISAFYKKWMFGKVACQLYGLVGGLFGLMSINTLTAISIDRYFVITKPLHAASSMTRKKSFMMIICVWIWSALWAFPPIFGWGAYIPEGFQTSCTFDYLTKTPFMRSYIFCLYICGFAVPLFVICFCYILIVKSIHKHEQEMLKMARKMKVEDIKSNQEKRNTEIKIAKIAMVIITLYMISWSPYATVALIGQFGPSSWVTPFVSELPVMLAKASAMHNPIVYALNHPKFRDALYKRAPWIFCCCTAPPVSKPSLESRGRSGDKRNLSRTISACSASDMSSCISTLDDSAYGASIEMRKPGVQNTRETSLSREISERRCDDTDQSTSVRYSQDLVRELVHALVDVANSQSRQGPVIQPVYLPTLPPVTRNGSEARGGVSQDVYIVDNGKQMDLGTYLSQVVNQTSISCTTGPVPEKQSSSPVKETVKATISVKNNEKEDEKQQDAMDCEKY